MEMNPKSWTQTQQQLAYWLILIVVGAAIWWVSTWWS